MADNRIIQVGTAKVLTATCVLDAYVGVFNEAIKAKQNWKNNILLDSAGFWAGEDARDENIIITVNFKLTAASKALAAANGVFLRPLAKITLSVGDLAWINETGVGGYYTGAWCYHEGGSINLSNEQIGGMEISLRKFADPTQNAQQFVTPA